MRCLQPLLGGQQLLHAVHFHRQVLDPGRGVVVAVHGRLRGQFEKRQHIAVTGIEKHVHIRVRRLGRWHFVFGNGQHEIHVQVFHVPVHGLLGVAAAIGDVVDLLDFHDLSPTY